MSKEEIYFSPECSVVPMVTDSVIMVSDGLGATIDPYTQENVEW